MRQRIRTFGLATALAATCVAVVTLVADPAGAAVRSSAAPTATGSTAQIRQATSFTVTLTRTAGASPQERAAGAADVITCTGEVSTPYQAGAAVRVDVRASCDIVVDQIEISAGMDRDHRMVVQTQREPALNTAAADHFVVYPCPGVTARYQGGGVARFTKAGYSNSPLVRAGASLGATITC